MPSVCFDHIRKLIVQLCAAIKKKTLTFYLSAKSKTYQSGSYHSSNGKASGQSSTSSVRSDMSDFKNDLAFRMSLTNEAEEQRIGLKRVPSVGETNTMDLTVNDDDFFDNGNIEFTFYFSKMI